MISRSLWQAQTSQDPPEVAWDSGLEEMDDVAISQGDVIWADDILELRKSRLPVPSTRSKTGPSGSIPLTTVDGPSSSRSSHNSASLSSAATTTTTSTTSSTVAINSEDSCLTEAAKKSLILPSKSPAPSSQSHVSLQTKPITSAAAEGMSTRRSRHQTRTKSAPSTPRSTTRTSDPGNKVHIERVPSVPSLPSGLACSTRTQGEQTQSFRSHNLTSLRDMAAAWVPGTARHQPSQVETGGLLLPEAQLMHQQQLVPIEKGGKQLSTQSSSSRAQIRLDRRRIDKAIGLAVEAAQAAEQDERLRKSRIHRKKIRAAERACRTSALEREKRQQSSIFGKIKNLSEHSALSDGEGGSRFGSLPWRRRDAPASPAKSMAPRSRTTPNSPHTSDEDAPLDDEDILVPADEDESDDGEDEEEDNFSLSLYLSSLSYLLSALSSKDAGQLPPKERDSLKAKLHEVLRDIGDDGEIVLHSVEDGRSSRLDDEAVREERLRELIEIELRKAEARMTSGSQGGRFLKINTGSPSLAKQNTPAQSSNSLASNVALSALELTFTVAAAGIGFVGSGLSRFAPPSTSNAGREGDGVAPRMEEAKIIGEAAADANDSQQRSKAHEIPVEVSLRNGFGGDKKGSGKGASGTGLQWDLAMALASSTASTLYGCLSSAADEAARQDAALTFARRTKSDGGTQSAEDEALSAVTRDDLQNMPEDQLILLSASFARALKQSPLPSQVARLSSQLLALLHSLDERYSLSKRATDEAFRRTRQGLGYARRRGWHVKVVRAAWALVEMSVAGVEAWREEDSYQIGDVGEGKRVPGLSSSAIANGQKQQ